MKWTLFLTLVFLLGAPVSLHAIEMDQLEDLVGYTLIEVTAVPGDFEGADFDKVVKLENGMIFEFEEYNYSYSFHPDVAIFARKAEIPSKPSDKQKGSVILYKLLIEDDIYDVHRIR
jgi:hypothetical protein